MSQKVSTRKGAIGTEDKEKKPRDSPAKEIKKKIAANVEKEKPAADKSDKPTEKQPEKVAEKQVEKDKKEKKETEKKDAQQPEKSKDESKTDKSAKNDKTEKDTKKQNGAKVHNGVTETVTVNSNGTGDEMNGTVSDSDDEPLIIDDDEPHDETFPELTYEDSDAECFEPPTPENLPSRSFTRRSQPKEKVLKLKDDAPHSDRKLRSSDSPKPQEKKGQEQAKPDDGKETEKTKEKEGDDKQTEEKKDNSEHKTTEKPVKEPIVVVEVMPEIREEKIQENSDKTEKLDVEIVEVEADDEARKLGTNYSKSRVKVSPYRRTRTDRNDRTDRTDSSLLANYTGNNTTMEMDITESFVSEDSVALDDSSYLRGLRSIRGRNSYKVLQDMPLRHVNRSSIKINVSGSESRPTAPVVGRKRKPENEREQEEREPEREHEREREQPAVAPHKRARLLDRIAAPFRRTTAGEIVGINTDLPLTAPVITPEPFDPESLKTSSPAATGAPHEPIATPLLQHERDSKRCAIM